ncbi:cysteine desulfurase [bacterium]|nr:MAG: cysteine desulfurase [bacterium]
MSVAQKIIPVSVSSPLDVERIRQDFPILTERIHGKPLIYLDNAATTQKPLFVIDAVHHYYRAQNANIHRGTHYLSQVATFEYEKARGKIRQFINAKDNKEIIFVRGTTEAINLVSSAYGRKFIRAGDEIIISAMEHHSNIVPWQILCEQTGAVLRVIPMNQSGELIMEEYVKLLNEKTKLVSVVHISNALGTVNPVKEIIRLAHERNIPVMLDAAQSIPHAPVDVRDLDCDFLVFSGHKMYGPTGVGVLYGKQQLLESMPPYHGGGDMIRTVSFEKTTYAELPNKFEAGTPNIAGGIGLGAAVDYINRIGIHKIAEYETELMAYATEKLSAINKLKIIGTAKEKAGAISFVMENVHPHDAGTLLDLEGIAIRTGHHCAQPVMQFYGIPATSRASLSFYNTKEDVDALVKGLHKVMEVFK